MTSSQPFTFTAPSYLGYNSVGSWNEWCKKQPGGDKLSFGNVRGPLGCPVLVTVDSPEYAITEHFSIDPDSVCHAAATKVVHRGLLAEYLYATDKIDAYEALIKSDLDAAAHVLSLVYKNADAWRLGGAQMAAITALVKAAAMAAFAEIPVGVVQEHVINRPQSGFNLESGPIMSLSFAQWQAWDEGEDPPQGMVYMPSPLGASLFVTSASIEHVICEYASSRKLGQYFPSAVQMCKDIGLLVELIFACDLIEEYNEVIAKSSLAATHITGLECFFGDREPMEMAQYQARIVLGNAAALDALAMIADDGKN